MGLKGECPSLEVVTMSIKKPPRDASRFGPYDEEESPIKYGYFVGKFCFA